ncbi:MAG: SHOCT domain-containing protein [Oryzomonas sp.]
MLSSSSDASDVRRLWQSRDQFVALERQDSVSTGNVPLNDHPARIDIDRLTEILSSIAMRATGDGKPESLFTGPAVQVLAPHLQQALQQAAPGEDVTFAIIGLHNTLYGFAKSPKVTTGRIFYQAGRLNVIVGLVQRDVSDRDDRRLSPFIPGSRQKAQEGEWTLLPQPGRNGFALVRKDWVTFSDEWRASVPQSIAGEQKVPPVQTAPVQPEKRNNDPRSPADRLTTLNELKDKGLISEEEYRSKRREILNGL